VENVIRASVDGPKVLNGHSRVVVVLIRERVVAGEALGAPG
jgi:hypothetical protein